MDLDFCYDCGRRRTDTEFCCPVCGCDVYTDAVPGTAKPNPIGAEADLHGIFGALFKLPPGAVALVFGLKGTGKTSLCFDALEKPIAGSWEMDPDQVLTYAARLKRPVARVTRPELVTPEEGDPYLRLPNTEDIDSHDVIIDSISSHPDPVSVTKAAIVYAKSRGVRVLLISHATKAGEARGSSTIQHDVDAVIQIKRRGHTHEAIAIKCRFDHVSSVLFRFIQGEIKPPKWDRFYSIEGQAPEYRITPYPSGGPLAAPLRAAEKYARKNGGQLPAWLPPPPIAVAAENSPLYSGGWISPEDEAARRAYSEANGLPFWKPAQMEGA